MLSTDPLPPLRILSIDGGGVRGIIPGQVLEHIETEFTLNLRDYFDVFTGASAGSFYAAGLVHPDIHSARHINQIFIKDAPLIFYHNSLLWKIVSLDYVIGGPEYSNKPLITTTQNTMGQALFSSSLKRVIIPSTNLGDETPFYFDSANPIDPTTQTWSVCCASSAAPYYFAPFPLSLNNVSYTFGDGGIHDNNPSLSALLKTRAAGQKTLCLSLATGFCREHINASIAKKGLLGWGSGLLNLILDTESEKTHQQMLLVADKYLRIQSGNLPEDHSDLNDASPANIAFLEKTGDQLFERHRDNIEHLIRQSDKYNP